MNIEYNNKKFQLPLRKALIFQTGSKTFEKTIAVLDKEKKNFLTEKEEPKVENIWVMKFSSTNHMVSSAINDKFDEW